jgi:hypothetical protein
VAAMGNVVRRARGDAHVAAGSRVLPLAGTAAVVDHSGRNDPRCRFHRLFDVGG